MPQQLQNFKNEVSIIDRSETGLAGQRLDFVQEEFLKKGMAIVKMGKIVEFEVFREGIRNSYHSEKENPCKKTKRNKRFYKWDLEVKSACSVQMLTKNIQQIGMEMDLGDLDEDLLRIEEMAEVNLRLFYTSFISGKQIKTNFV